MNRHLARVIAAVAHPLAIFAARRLSDGLVLRLLQRLQLMIARRRPGDHLVTVLGEACLIFRDPAGAKLARRLILESRPQQFKAVVRGALR